MTSAQKYFLLNAVIFISFISMAVFNAYDESSKMRTFTREREIPALGIAAYSRLNNTAAYYKDAGSNLLQRDFIQNWITDGEVDVEGLLSFMEEIRAAYGLLDASLVSDLSETYYGTDGRVLNLSPDKPDRDGWYYHYRETVGKSNIDSWYYPETGVVGLYVNIPVRDENGDYIGVTGGGVDSTVFDRLLKTLENDWNIRIYMVRSDGRLVYATESQLLEPPVKMVDDIWEMPILDKITRDKHNAAGMVIEPDGNSGAILWAGYMPEWETFLIIERDSEAMSSAVRNALLASLVGGGFLTILLIILTLFVFRFVSRRTSLTVNTSRNFVHRFQSIIYIQNTMLEKAETMLVDSGEDFAGRELRQKREALKLMMSSDSRTLKVERVNLNDVIHDLLLKKSSEFLRRGINLHSRFSAKRFVISGNDTLVGFLIGDLLDKAAMAVADESEIVLLTGNLPQSVTLDIAFPFDFRTEIDFDVSMLKPVLEVMNANLEIDESGNGSRIFHLEFQLSGE